MTSWKNYCMLFIILHFVTNACAQFTGYYNLHDGGVDIPSSSLFVLPNNEFLLFYYDGYQIGSWKEIDNSTIVLSVIKGKTVPITIYGKYNKNLTGISIDVYGLAKANAFINFSKDTTSKKEFQPIFNDLANCLGDDYKIKKMVDESNWVTISYPADPDFGRNSVRYPYKALTYTFPLNRQYNDYVAIQNEDALLDIKDFTITKKNGIFTINDQKSERTELTDEILKKIDDAKRLMNNKEIKIKEKFGTNVIAFSTGKTDIFKPVLKPLFIAKCDDDVDEHIDEKQDNFKLLPRADRVNGFNTVVNFKENEYDAKKYQLAKEPSIQKDDILSVSKVLSDYGGYEIQITFTEKGSEKLAQLSRTNIRKPIAIVVNKLIISSPLFASEITGGKANIAGGFSEAEVDEIIANLKN